MKSELETNKRYCHVLSALTRGHKEKSEAQRMDLLILSEVVKQSSLRRWCFTSPKCRRGGGEAEREREGY